MTIFMIRAKEWNIPLKQAFTISRSSTSIAKNVMVRVEADGITGVGEAAPNSRYSETQDSTLSFIHSLHTFQTHTPCDLKAFVSWLDDFPKGHYAARAGLEMAMLDWIGKKLKKPAHVILEAPRRTGPVSSFTIGIDQPKIIVEKVKAADKYPVLKIKLGSSDDKEIIRVIREVTSKPLIIDANEGWKSYEEAVEMIRFLQNQNIMLIEQPMPADAETEMRDLKKQSEIPLYADESFTGNDSLDRIADGFHGINIKLMKTGSLLKSIALISAARTKNLGIMTGCMLQSAVADSASAIISMWADYADIDGRLLLEETSYEWHGLDDDARLLLSDEHGLGLTHHYSKETKNFL